MELRPYQREACDSAWRWLNNNAGNCVICLPTGAGKSLCIADLCRQTLEWGFRAVVLANRKELLQQNAEKIHKLIPNASLGVYSAGLNYRHTDHDIIVAGIQSVFRKAAELGSRQLVIPDECHLIPARDEGMYRTFLSDLRAAGNEDLRVIGMTATPFRTGEGSLCRANGVFQGIAYNADLKQLIQDGYLCPLTNRPTVSEVRTQNLHTRAGEFVAREVEDLFAPVIRSACAEIVAATSDRHSVLIFCTGVSHAEQVAQEIERITGAMCGVVTGGTPPLERAALLDRFRKGELKYLTNVDVLTTGFDAPCIDVIAILRATQSPGLLVQMVGRGLRKDQSKNNCLILDFGENIKRHGPIDAIDFGKNRNSAGGTTGDAPSKVCPNCQELQPAGLRECECGFRFPAPTIRHEETADKDSAVLAAPIPPITWEVEEINMHRHKKRGDGPNTLRVDYTCRQRRPDKILLFDEKGTTELDSIPDDPPRCKYCKRPASLWIKGTPQSSSIIGEWYCPGSHLVLHVYRPSPGNLTETISEWVCLEHDGFALRKAHSWWTEHTRAPFSGDIDEAIDLFNRGAFRMPTQITTVKDGRWNRIQSRIFEDDRPESWSEEAFIAPWEEGEPF